MQHIWIALGAVLAVVAVAAPLAAIVLVSIASRREESVRSLTGHAPGVVTAAARRLLAFHSDGPASRSGRRPGRVTRNSGRPGPGSRTGGRAPRLEPVRVTVDATRGGQGPGAPGQPELEVRFGHARRPLPDSGQQPARRQSQPRPVRTDQRQGAGV